MRGLISWLTTSLLRNYRNKRLPKPLVQAVKPRRLQRLLSNNLEPPIQIQSMTLSAKIITMHYAKPLKHAFGSLLFILTIAVSGSLVAVCAQEKSKSQPAAKKVANDAGR